MSDYTPDKWVVVKIQRQENDTPLYKVFACWYGGWAGADSWKLNSGITRVTLDGYCYMFEGYSGSVYECHESCYGTNFYGQGVLENLITRIEANGGTCEIMDENTNWLELEYDNALDSNS